MVLNVDHVHIYNRHVRWDFLILREGIQERNTLSFVIIHCQEEGRFFQYTHPLGSVLLQKSTITKVYCHSFFQSGSVLEITLLNSQGVLTVYKFNTLPLYKEEWLSWLRLREAFIYVLAEFVR